MNKQQIDEFLRLDMQISQEYDAIRNNGNKQWRLRRLCPKTSSCPISM